MERYKSLTLLHSNDIHGDFFAEKVDDRFIGGVAMLSGYVNKVKNEEKNCLYCIAGDMFRGSVVDSEFRGVSTIEIINILSPDVVALGNHEVDYGIGHLLFIEKCAKFPIINANLYVKTSGTRLFRPYYIAKVNGMKILFIGIITQDVVARTRTEPIIGAFVDVNEAVSEVGKICNAYKSVDIDLTVLLTHIGIEEDKTLASRLDPDWGVDIIIGGHSHTYMTQPLLINDVLVVQAGMGSDQIGRFDITVDTEENRISDYKWERVDIHEGTCEPDESLERILKFYKGKTDRKYSRFVTKFNRQLTHPSRCSATELGELFADIFRKRLGVDIFFIASGSLRSRELGPVVLLSDFVECFAYDEPIYMLQVTGRQLKNMLEFLLRDEVWSGAHCEFYQFSKGLKVVYNKSEHDFKEFSFNGKPVEDKQLYKIGMQHYHFTNLEKFFSVSYRDICRNAKPRIVATSGKELLEEYLSSHQNLDHHIDGRLIIE